MKSILIISFFLISCISFAQQTNEIRGIVKDQNKEPLSFASVVLYNQVDSTMVTATGSDDNGAFVLKAEEGSYYIQLQFLSFQPFISEPIHLSERSIDVGSIILEPNSENLDEVVVSTNRSAMEIQLDKRVYNLDKDPMNKGRNASEILDNLPSVNVDIDGNVSLRGSENVRILVDGKPSGLTGIRGTESLKNLQGNILEKIEIITNPSARYDAEGEVGIINIVLKKDRKKGVNGSFDARAGYPEDVGGGFTLNYRTGAVNFFANYGVGYNKRPGSGWSIQRFETADTSFSYERNRDHRRGGWSNTFRTGANIYLGNDHVITASGLYSYSRGDNEVALSYRDIDQYGEPSQFISRDEAEIELEQTIEASFNYTKTFKRKSQQFTFDFQFTDAKDEESSNISEVSDQNSVDDIDQRVSNKENEQKWLIQTDYIHPWGKDGKIETGLKAMLRSIDNDFTVEQQDGLGDWTILSSFDNQFLYTENIYAGYLMAGNKWGNFQAQCGLRLEYSDVKTVLVNTNEVNHRKYLDFFPTTHLAYEFEGQNTLQLSYSRRITRPRFWSLLPFFGYSDSRNLFGGNPNLNPEYTHSFELGHLKYFKNGSILSSVYYRHTTGKNERLILSDSAGFTQIYPVNIGIENSVGVECTVSYQPWSWWDISGSVNIYRAIMEGDYLGIDYFNDTYAWNGNVKSKWSIAKVFHVQLSLNYISPMLDPQGEILSRYNIDGGLSLDLFKGKGTLTLNARDIFNTRKRRYIISGDGFYNEGEFQWRARQFTLNFSYRLNQPKSKGGKRGSGGSGYGG